MKILALIPARGGSKGIPHKNIKFLGEKPLINYTIETALACPEIDELIISTDDEKIAEISHQAGAKVPFLRPEYLASDKSPTIDTVIHSVQFFEEQNIFFDAVCLLQPTVPFRQVSDIQDAIEQFKNSGADSLISVREVPHVYNPHWVFETEKDSPFLKIATGEKEVIPRRQELPKAYHRDGSIYITKRDILINEHSLYGEKITFQIIENSPNVNIDTMEDWRLAEEFLNT